MENITCELNGVKYLLVELPLMSRDEARLNATCEKYEVIMQGIKEINRGGFFSEPVVIAKVLVPEKNIMAFNDEI